MRVTRRMKRQGILTADKGDEGVARNVHEVHGYPNPTREQSLVLRGSAVSA